MKRGQGSSRLLIFDAICRHCLLRIHAREELAVEVLSDEGFHRGWAHDSCAEGSRPDEKEEP